jgi:RNA polymerase sigma-70 factor (ECF subfamily)
MDRDSDSALVAAAIAGDMDAFAALSRRHRDRCTRFAVRMVGSVDDADDVLQSAFMRAYRGLASCRNPERFGSWLYQIVANECRTFATRRARRERRFVQELEFDGAVPPLTDARETLADIQYALDRLEPEQREAFLLKHVEDLSYDEMAEITGAGISALKMRVKRACERLRAMLEEVHDV